MVSVGLKVGGDDLWSVTSQGGSGYLVKWLDRGPNSPLLCSLMQRHSETRRVMVGGNGPFLIASLQSSL